MELAKNVLDLDLVSLEPLNMTWVVIVYHSLLSTLSEHIVHIEGWLVANFTYSTLTENYFRHGLDILHFTCVVVSWLVLDKVGLLAWFQKLAIKEPRLVRVLCPRH